MESQDYNRCKATQHQQYQEQQYQQQQYKQRRLYGLILIYRNKSKRKLPSILFILLTILSTPSPIECVSDERIIRVDPLGRYNLNQKI